MNTSLYSRILSENDADAALLDAWLMERSVEKALSAVPDEPMPCTVDARRLGQSADSYDNHVEPGQIRLLSTEFVADDGVIPYVAVLDRWMEDMWLVAPFSPYGIPATEGEMATGISLVGQRVLQCWNARTAHEALVSQSYVAGMLGESVRRDALALFRHAMAGKELPADFSALVGAPILSKADPRREYIVESAARFAPLTDAAMKLEAVLAHREQIAKRRDELRQSAAFARPTYGKRDFALAAGDKAGQTVETFAIPSLGVELDVKHTPSEGKVRLVVYRGGERDGATLEGFVVADKDATPIGEIQDGLLVADAAALADGILLIEPETLEPVPMEKKEEDA